MLKREVSLRHVRRIPEGMQWENPSSIVKSKAQRAERRAINGDRNNQLAVGSWQLAVGKKNTHRLPRKSKQIR